MDFDDTPQEAAFRDEGARLAREERDAARPRRRRRRARASARTGDAIARAKAWQAEEVRRGLGGAHLAEGVRRPQRLSRVEAVVWGQEEAQVQDAAADLRHRPRHARPDAHGARHGRAEEAATCSDMARGQVIWCQLFSEPAAGSDLAGLRTTAVRDGDDWIINGQKIWTTGAHYCDWGMIVTRTDPNAAKHAGLTYFIVDMHAPGRRDPADQADQRRLRLQRGVLQATCACPTRTASARSATAGASRSRRS